MPLLAAAVQWPADLHDLLFVLRGRTVVAPGGAYAFFQIGGGGSASQEDSDSTRGIQRHRRRTSSKSSDRQH
eukprot:51248-Chlamydomonas_euryale.AAC.1